MTQIKKTLSIAGIIAMVSAPAMADIASTAYVQNIVNNVIPQSGTAGDVLKKTASGVEWAAAPSVPENVVVYNNDVFAIGRNADAEENSTSIGDGATSGAEATAVGGGATASGGATSIGTNTNAAGYGSIAMGVDTATTETDSIGIGYASSVNADGAVAIGAGIDVGKGANGAIVIGRNARVGENAQYAIQLGAGTNNTPKTFSVSFGFGTENYILLDSNGTMPYERFAPTMPDDCKELDGQKCALVVTWNASEEKFTQSWEVIKVSE